MSAFFWCTLQTMQSCGRKSFDRQSYGRWYLPFDRIIFNVFQDCQMVEYIYRGLLIKKYIPCRWQISAFCHDSDTLVADGRIFPTFCQTKCCLTGTWQMHLPWAIYHLHEYHHIYQVPRLKNFDSTISHLPIGTLPFFPPLSFANWNTGTNPGPSDYSARVFRIGHPWSEDRKGNRGLPYLMSTLEGWRGVTGMQLI